MKLLINWKTKVTYVDLETGVVLSEYDAKTNYKTIKKKKTNVAIRNTHGIIEYTAECRNKRQTRLFD